MVASTSPFFCEALSFWAVPAAILRSRRKCRPVARIGTDCPIRQQQDRDQHRYPASIHYDYLICHNRLCGIYCDLRHWQAGPTDIIPGKTGEDGPIQSNGSALATGQ